MKFKMSDWKKIHDSEDHAIMRNDNGHELKIMKKSLNPKLLDQLAGIPGHKEKGQRNPKLEQSRVKLAYGDVVEAEQPAMPEIIEDEPVGMAPAIPNFDVTGPEKLRSLANPEAVAFQDQQSANLERIGQADEQKLRGSERLEALQDPEALQPEAPRAPAAAPTEVEQPVEAAPEAAPAPVVEKPGDQLQKVASAVQTLSDVEKAVKDAQVQSEAAQQNYQEKFDALNQERQALIDDVNAGHIDPKRFWSNLSTSDKMSNVVGLVLGGLGQAYIGGENPAMKIIENNIERDIKAQQIEMDKRNNLLSANMRQFGNLKDAAEMTRAHQMDIVGNQLKLAAVKTDDMNAKTNALKVAGELQAKANEIQQKVVSATISRDAAKSIEKDPKNAEAVLAQLEIVDPKRAEDLRGRLIPGWGLAQTEADAKNLKEGIDEKGNFNRKLDELIALRQKHSGGALLNRDDVNRGKQLSKELLLSYKNMAKLGVLSKSDESIINTVITADPLSYRSLVAAVQGQDPVLHTLRSFKNDSDRDFKSTLSLRLSGGAEAAERGLAANSKEAQLDPKQKAMADWARKNPNDPRATKVLRALGLE